MSQSTERVMHPDESGSYNEVTTDTPCSIEVTRNAKGDYQWSIKTYCGQETYDLLVAVDQLQEVDRKLRASFLREEAK